MSFLDHFFSYAVVIEPRHTRTIRKQLLVTALVCVGGWVGFFLSFFFVSSDSRRERDAMRRRRENIVRTCFFRYLRVLRSLVVGSRSDKSARAHVRVPTNSQLSYDECA